VVLQFVLIFNIIVLGDGSLLRLCIVYDIIFLIFFACALELVKDFRRQVGVHLISVGSILILCLIIVMVWPRLII